MENAKQEIRDERYYAARRATILSVVINVFLSIGKIIAGLLGNSAAMLADGIHSASDLVTDGVVLVAMRIARKDADEDHPFGHGKFETLATQFVSVALLVVAIGIAVDAWERLINPDLTAPTSLALGAAIISILAKEAIFQYTYRMGKRHNSKALIANAWHHRSDAVSSIAALIGVAGAMAGYPILDPMAAIVVALILGKVGVELFTEALKDLTDSAHAIDKEVQREISNLVHEVPGVVSAHLLNPRGLGPDIRVDVHVVVDGFLSVSEGHQIAEHVRYHLLDEVEAITEVMVHVDTVDDHEEVVNLFVNRQTLEKLVADLTGGYPLFANVARMTPHYLQRGILLELTFEVDLEYPMPLLRAEADVLATKILAAGKDVFEVKISFVMVDKLLSELPASKGS